MGWKRVVGFEDDYHVRHDGVVQRISTKKILTVSNGRVQLLKDGKYQSRSVEKIVKEAHRSVAKPIIVKKIEVMEKAVWRVIPGFPDYRISNFGEVERIKPVMVIRPSGPFHANVMLWRDGKQYSRGLRKLTKDTFGVLSLFQ